MEPHSRQASLHQEAETQLRVIVIDPAWHRCVPNVVARVSRAVQAACRGAGLRPEDECRALLLADPGLSVVLADDRLVRQLNARHRGRDKPTNILTYEHPAPELVLARGVIRREATAAGRCLSHHLAHLVVHGVLHLLGFDHDRPGDARRMEMAEARLLHRIGVPNPWKSGARA